MPDEPPPAKEPSAEPRSSVKPLAVTCAVVVYLFVLIPLSLFIDTPVGVDGPNIPFFFALTCPASSIAELLTELTGIPFVWLIVCGGVQYILIGYIIGAIIDSARRRLDHAAALERSASCPRCGLPLAGPDSHSCPQRGSDEHVPTTNTPRDPAAETQPDEPPSPGAS